ncbi:TPA: hypothetical protein HA278_02565, partial [Candidatus Woesearchaeota archaeon]|nr:hypothetical protein [Candidatus Woesearchaeota archaeon]
MAKKRGVDESNVNSNTPQVHATNPQSSQVPAKKSVKAKCRTGIKALDQVLGGGFPKDAVVLVGGNSGAGKTILSLEWIFNGVTQFNENGVYVTFTEPLFKTLKNLEGMAFYKRDIIENEKIKILDLRQNIGTEDFAEEKLLSLIEAEVKKNGARRLIIDSITAIAYILNDKAKIRRFIFDLGTLLSTLGCTTILTSEVTGDTFSVYGVEEFISDGILILKYIEENFQSVRTLQIVKMRGINFQKGMNAFRITTNGIRMFPQLQVQLNYASGKEKLSSGVTGLDKMSHGGFFRGSTNLIAGSTGTGKSVLGLHFLWEGLKQGEHCLLAGFEESRDQILRNALAFGFDFEKYEKKGLL